MKKLIPFLVLLAGTCGTFAQGVVNFNNSVLAAPPDRFVYNTDGSKLTGTNFVAQLYYQNSAGQWVAHTGTSFFRVSTTSSPGTWSGGNRTLTGAGGVDVPVNLQVWVWDAGANRSLTYDQSPVHGQSSIFSYRQALNSPPQTTDTQMVGFSGFTLVPEPSVIGLGVIGIGALFLLRRRK